MSKILNISAREILDSRGELTIEAEVQTEKGVKAIASVPQGKSTGSREDVYVAPKWACENVAKEIAPALIGLEVSNQSELDQKMLDLDGTPNERRLGANAILAVSLACARAGALEAQKPLWRYLRELYGQPTRAGNLALYVNMINGGLHAGNNLDIQEYLVIVEEGSLQKSVETATKIYHLLGKLLVEKFGESAANLGDEGGFAPDFKDNLAPFEYLKQAMSEVTSQARLGIDAAASNIEKSPVDLFKFYREAKQKYDLLYIEDPFGEDDDLNFKALTLEMGKDTIITGDDLTTTNPKSIREFGGAKAINGVIIKPNQAGSLSETLEAIRAARENNLKVVVSHRSGETDDDYIADLAYAVLADGIKLGSPARGERVAKYNRLLEIEREAGNNQ